LWNCKGNEEVVDRKEQIHLLLQPIVDLVVSASRTVTVPTTAVGVAKALTVIAAIETAFPHVGSTTAGDIPDGLAMARQNVYAVLLNVRGTVPVQNVGQ